MAISNKAGPVAAPFCCHPTEMTRGSAWVFTGRLLPLQGPSPPYSRRLYVATGCGYVGQEHMVCAGATSRSVISHSTFPVQASRAAAYCTFQSCQEPRALPSCVKPAWDSSAVRHPWSHSVRCLLTLPRMPPFAAVRCHMTSHRSSRIRTVSSISQIHSSTRQFVNMSDQHLTQQGLPQASCAF